MALSVCSRVHSYKCRIDYRHEIRTRYCEEIADRRWILPTHLKPFERVECDAHHIDAIFCILIPSVFGELIPKIIHRLWLVVVKDVASRATLGYHLSLREECNKDDILEAVRNSLSKWEPRELGISGMEYARKAGFPSSHNARFLRACWDEFSVDAGMANLSGPVVEKLKDVVDVHSGEHYLPQRWGFCSGLATVFVAW